MPNEVYVSLRGFFIFSKSEISCKVLFNFMTSNIKDKKKFAKKSLNKYILGDQNFGMFAIAEKIGI